MAHTEIIKIAAAMGPFRFLEKIVRDAGIHLEVVHYGPRDLDYETPDGRIRLVCAVEHAPDPQDPSGWELNFHLMLQDENEVSVCALWDQDSACWKMFWDSGCEVDDIEPWLSAIIARHALGEAGTGRSVLDDIAETFVQDCARAYLDTLN